MKILNCLLYVTFVIALFFTGCIAKYPTHLYQVSDNQSEEIALVFIKYPLQPVSVDEKSILHATRSGRAWDVLKLSPGSHEIEIKHVTKNVKSGYGYTTTSTLTYGPWEKSLDTKPGYIYLIEADQKGERGDDDFEIKPLLTQTGPIEITTLDGDYLISLSIPDVSKKAYFKYAVKNLNSNEENIYPVFEYLNDIPTFSPDKKRVAFGPNNKDKNNYFLNVDGIEGVTFQYFGNETFSPNSKSFVYRAEINKKWYMVVNGKLSKAYDKIWAPIFSDDGERMSFIAKNYEKYTVVIDGDENEFYDNVFSLKFSNDGTSVGFIAYEEDKERIVVNGSPEPLYDDVSDLTFSPNDQQFSYAAKIGDKWQMAFADHLSNPYDLVLRTRYSSKGKKTAFVAKIDDKYLMVTDGNESELYDGITHATFSNDEKNVAYIAELRDTKFVVLNGKNEPSYKNVQKCKFSKTGKLTYEVKEDETWEVIVKEIQD